MKTKGAIFIFICLLLVSCAPEIATQESNVDVTKIATEAAVTEISATQELVVTEKPVDPIATNSAPYSRGWIPLGGPPYGVVRVVSEKYLTVWVESSHGDLYTVTLDFGCGMGLVCWAWNLATATPEDNGPLWPLVRGTDCTSLNPNPYRPIINPDGAMQECVYAPVPGIDTVAEFFFALMSDGTIWFFDNTPPFVPK